MEKDFTLFLTSTVKTSSIMKLTFLLSLCVSIQIVSGFTFPSPTLVPITELTEPKIIQVSREDLLSSFRQLRLTFMKNLQVISKLNYFKNTYSTLYFCPSFVDDVEMKVRTRPRPTKLNSKMTRFSRIPTQSMDLDSVYYIRRMKK